ncbi:MAG: glycosyltransferase family 4 protein [Anaerolineaceae bacterium]
MHILLIHQAFASLDEAGGTRHYEIARILVSQGHKVTIITSPVNYLTGRVKGTRLHWVEKEIPLPGITILRVYVYPALHRSFFHRLINFFSFMFSSFFVGLGIKNVDAIWGTSPPIFQGWTAWCLARIKHSPFLFEIRDLWPEFAIGIGVLKNKLLIKLSYWLESFLYRHADQIVVNSPGFIPYMTQQGGKNIALVPNGVDPDMFDPSDTGQAFRDEHHFGSSFIVLYAGAHGISNDLEVVLSAAMLTQDTALIQYVFVGDGKEKQNLIHKAQELNLANVHFFASVPKQQMHEILAAADVCIAILKPLDLYKTTYPNKVFDYLAAGRPVLLAIDGVIRQVVEDAQAGIFVPPGDANSMAQAILKLFSDQASAREMGENGRTYVIAHFNRKELALQLEKIFYQLTKTSKSK